MDKWKTALGLKEIIIVLGLTAMLYGGIEGVQAIAKSEAENQLKDHQLEVQPVFEELRTEQRVIKEQVNNNGKALGRIEEKLDE